MGPDQQQPGGQLINTHTRQRHTTILPKTNSQTYVDARRVLSIDTLRYYEREGLVGPIQRQSGQRRYTDDDVAWIGLVTCLRTAGLGIADLRRFTELLRTQGDTHNRVTFLERRREELLQRLQHTQAAIDVLNGKIEHYTAHQRGDAQ